MKGLAHGGLSPNSSPMKMNGVAAWRTGSVLLLGSWERDRLGHAWSLVTQESQESSPWFPEMAGEVGV